ncbi:MAG: hypothetical protein HZC47_00010 [Methanobacterium sp.]|uniref:hypothetical protein n=1 Tax=Methanobacterium sp. TaxID=2164 RepID=UPI003D65579F|nr:hypothetical protein [Methanobacterium sp.]
MAVFEKYDVDGLGEVVIEIKKLKEEGYYFGLLMTNLEYGWFVDNETAYKELKCEVVNMGREFLGYQPINLPPFTRVIAYQDLQSLYNVLTGIYVTCIGRQLNSEEMEKISDNLEIRIMKNMTQFDQIMEKPEINKDYFKKLRKIKWGKNSRNLCLELGELKLYAGFPRRRTPARFQIEQDLLDQFLAACSAVNNSRDKIEQEDVIVAFKTYFKLLKTDLPDLVDRLEKGSI